MTLKRMTFRSGQTLEVDVDELVNLPINAYAPNEIDQFLHSRGWSITNNTMWRAQPAGPTYTWEQAMAIEFYKFITLGGR